MSPFSRFPEENDSKMLRSISLRAAAILLLLSTWILLLTGC
ncbi:MAG TPA: hypothetical protein VJL29_11080 [Thermoguttaceae bacterium]|nr:hypothetical protein [Thermoguttaceae bacterium]